MLNYTIFINNKNITQQFAKNSRYYGVIFIILGLLGVIFPQIMSLTSVIFIGWLLLFSAIITAIHTWQINKKDWLGWLKVIMFSFVSILIISNPIKGIIALSVIFIIYFIVDSILNFTLAFSIKPNNGWFIVLLNAILSLALGIYFLLALANPIKTIWLVGLLVGISLFFDGIMLLTLSKITTKS